MTESELGLGCMALCGSRMSLIVLSAHFLVGFPFFFLEIFFFLLRLKTQWIIFAYLMIYNVFLLYKLIIKTVKFLIFIHV